MGRETAMKSYTFENFSAFAQKLFTEVTTNLSTFCLALSLSPNLSPILIAASNGQLVAYSVVESVVQKRFHTKSLSDILCLSWTSCGDYFAAGVSVCVYKVAHVPHHSGKLNSIHRNSLISEHKG